MTVVLVFPPQAQPFLPHPALPLLSAVLAREGIEVRQRDLNLEAYEHFLSPETLTRLGMDAAAATAIHEAKQGIRSGGEQFDPMAYYFGIFSVRDGLKFISDRHPGLSWDLKHLRVGDYSTSAWDDIHNATFDRACNPFIDFFETFLDELAADPPRLLGISVAWREQLIPAFTLARLAKKRMPQLHVCMGGSMITHLSGYLQHKRKIFSTVDSFLPYEGETGLVRLAQALQGQGRLEDVPGLMFPQKKKVVWNRAEPVCDLSTLPCPDYHGLPLDHYYSPRRYLPISGSRGCYWGKCSFCSHHVSGSRFRQRRPEHVLAEMDALQREYGCCDFYFSDDSMPPALGRKLAQAIAEGARPYRWVSEIRFERPMDRGYFDALYAGGCRMLLFGLESPCQRVLDLMHKGIREEDVARELRDASDAGILTWVFYFLGFPGETEEEARHTLAFLLEHREHIDMVAGGAFILTRNSPVFEARSQYGVERIAEDPRLDLQISYACLMKEGLRWDPHALLEEFHATPQAHKFLEPFVVEPHLLYFPKSYFRSKLLAPS